MIRGLAFALLWLPLPALGAGWLQTAGERQWAALALVAAWLLGTGWVVWRQWQRKHRDRIAAANVPEVLIAYASQTGFAESIARHTAERLRASGLQSQVQALGEVDLSQLADPGLRHALFVVSTYGEGDAPDQAARFDRNVLAHPAQLPQLAYAVLALGDRSYAQYCGFGRRVDAWLSAAGARPLAPRIEVDHANADALALWQAQLTAWGAAGGEHPDWHPPALADWRLVERQPLNPGSPGAPAYLLKLMPADGATLPHWEAGDLVEIQPPLPPELDHTPTRRYSIAAIPADGALWLLVRQQRNADGRPGWCSHWLTEDAALAETTIPLRLQANPGFRLAARQAPLLLIGNGTGLAGLRALLRARVAAGLGANWLVFGERSPVHDAWFEDEFAAWATQGLLERRDRVYSRSPDPRAPRYVQDLLRQESAAVRAWIIDRGAHVHVCGSQRGMAPAVHAVLQALLGTEGLDALVAQGRYRRDVY